MKSFKHHILEKLKVSKNNIYAITLESLIDALQDYKKRNRLFYAVSIDLSEVFKQYPTVLEYHGTYTNRNIIGNEIQLIRYIHDSVPERYMIFIYFDEHLLTNSIQIENTEELNDIFGEEVLDKIYDYIITH